MVDAGRRCRKVEASEKMLIFWKHFQKMLTNIPCKCWCGRFEKCWIQHFFKRNGGATLSKNVGSNFCLKIL
jgi:hypothetical protein